MTLRPRSAADRLRARSNTENLYDTKDRTMTNFMSTTPKINEAVLMRRASAEDTARIRTLARLDDKRLPVGPFLVAEAGGEIVAARSLASGAVVAGPFRLTSDIVAMLRLRAAQVSELGERRSRRDSFQYAVAACA